MGCQRGRIAVVLVLVVAATVGAADLIRAPGEQSERLEKARADDLYDLDAPIATARYREPSPEAMAQAGLVPATVQMAMAEPPVIRLDEPPPADPPVYQIAQLTPRARVKVQAFIAAQTAALQAPDTDALAVLSGDVRPAAEDRPGHRSLGDQAKELLVKIAPSKEDARRGRWFIFAAAAGQAFGLNLIRDSEEGLRKAGWSVERLAVLGKGQVGVAWRNKGLQASLAVAQREVGALGVKVDDTLAGFSLSWRPEER